MSGLALIVAAWNCYISYKNRHAGLSVFPLLPYSQGRSTRYFDRLHDFSVTTAICYMDVYVNGFFHYTTTLWNSLPIECFPLT